MLAFGGWRARTALAVALVAVAATEGCGGGDEFSSTGSGNDTDASQPTGGSSGSGAGAGAGGSGLTGGMAGTAGAAGMAGGAGSDGGCADDDSDGVTSCDGDCDDGDPLSFPGGVEICGDTRDNDCAAGADDRCNGLGTWVSANTGDDANPGTQAQPVKTITQGISNAVSIRLASTRPRHAVYVAEGHYNEKVMMQEGVDLLGGYECNATACSWQRDFKKYDTAIFNTDFEGVLARFGVTRQTRIDGFRIMGLGGLPTSFPGSAALTLEGGIPTVENNRIFGGAVTGGSWDRGGSIGVHISGTTGGSPTPPPDALLRNNEIAGGTTPEVSRGIDLGAPRGFVWGAGTAPPSTLAEITENQIRGGNGRGSFGISAELTLAGTRIARNDISGGAANGDQSWGIGFGGIVEIDSNRINLDATRPTTCASQNWCGGITSFSGFADITNNVVFGAAAAKSAAVRLAQIERAAGEIVLSSNYLSGGPPRLAAATAPTTACIVLTNPGCSGCAAARIGRIRNNILDGGAGSQRYGVVEEQQSDPLLTVHPENLQNNDFFLGNQANDVLYRHWTGNTAPTDMASLAAVNLLLFGSGNFSADPLVDATFHLSAGSPCINKGLSSDAPSTDFDGEQRPKGNVYDVGPDEAE